MSFEAKKKFAKVMFNPEQIPCSTEELFGATAIVQDLATNWLRTSNTEGAKVARGYLRKGRALTNDFILSEGIGYVPFEPRFTTRTLVENFTRAGGEPYLLAAIGCCMPNTTFVNSEYAKKYPRLAHNVTSAELTEFFLQKLSHDPKAYLDYPPFEVEPEGSGKFLRGEYLMLPLHVRDAKGNLGVGSWIRRSLRENTKRYMSPKNTKIFSSRDTILGLAGNEDRLDRVGHAVIQEGLFDKYSVTSAYGSEEFAPVVLAMGGTGSSPQANASSIQRVPEKYRVFHGKRITLFLDNDRGGFNAAIGNALQLMAAGATVCFASLRDACKYVGNFDLKDTNDLLKYAKKIDQIERGYEGIRNAVSLAQSRDVVTFIAEQITHQRESSPVGKRLLFTFDALAYLLPIIDVVPQHHLHKALDVAGASLGMQAEDVQTHLYAYQEQKNKRMELKPVEQLGAEKPRRFI